jgi:1-aminocyclopropane-1-carboxylate deaminase/D-cysteine desulfhydrase-like pyridoxal-dependent ACC family enzyme
MYGLFDLMEQCAIPPHSNVVAVHTGGLWNRTNIHF